MSLSIIAARSSVPRKEPAATDLLHGELALNFAAAGPFLSVKDSKGTIRRLDRVETSAEEPASPTQGQFWFDIRQMPGILRVWVGNSWQQAVATANNALATSTTAGLVRLADATALSIGVAGRVVDAAQLLAVSSRIVQSDWLAPPGTLGEILNKPEINQAPTVPPATTAEAGIVRLASNADILAGTGGRVVDAAQLRPVRIASDEAQALAAAALPRAGGVVTNGLTVNGVLVAAGGLTGNLAGRATSADRLATARSINGVPFDGTADITISTGGGGPTALQLLSPGEHLSGGAFDGTMPRTWTVNTTPAAVPGSIVSRDSAGNIAANILTGNLAGNAATATEAARLSTRRNINGVPFDGTADITISTLPGNQAALTPGAWLTGSVYTGATPTTWDVVASAAGAANTLAARDAQGALTASRFVGPVTGNVTGDVSGTAVSATRLQTPRKINGVDFDGTQDITIKADGMKLYGAIVFQLSGGSSVNQRPTATILDKTDSIVSVIASPRGISTDTSVDVAITFNAPIPVGAVPMVQESSAFAVSSYTWNGARTVLTYKSSAAGSQPFAGYLHLIIVG